MEFKGTDIYECVQFGADLDLVNLLVSSGTCGPWRRLALYWVMLKRLLLYPVVHVLLSLCCQNQRPPLLGPLGCVHSKGIVAVPEHRNQSRHFAYVNVEVLKIKGHSHVTVVQLMKSMCCPRFKSQTNLLLVILCVVDKEDAVLPAVTFGGLLQGDAHVHPALRLPVSPPAQRTFTHPHRLGGGGGGQRWELVWGVTECDRRGDEFKWRQKVAEAVSRCFSPAASCWSPLCAPAAAAAARSKLLTELESVTESWWEDLTHTHTHTHTHTQVRHLHTRQTHIGDTHIYIYTCNKWNTNRRIVYNIQITHLNCTDINQHPNECVILYYLKYCF